jgi:mannan endo-1,4-beta-mannosidase
MAFFLLMVIVLGMVMSRVECRLRGRSNSTKSFAGSNLYFLHALPQDEQKAYVEKLASWNAKVVRLWGTSTLENA